MSYQSNNQAKTTPLIDSLNQLIEGYQSYRDRLSVFIRQGNFNNFKELHLHFETLISNAHTDISDIYSRKQSLTYTIASTPKKKPFLVSTDVLIATRDSKLMVAYILDNHKDLILQMQEVKDQASITNDKYTIGILNRLMHSLEMESWILRSWADMYNELLLQRFRLTELKHQSELDSIRFRRTKMF